jgi:hypothetical protein
MSQIVVSFAAILSQPSVERTRAFELRASYQGERIRCFEIYHDGLAGPVSANRETCAGSERGQPK